MQAPGRSHPRILVNSAPNALVRGEGGEEETELMVIYLNGRIGRRQAEVALHIGSDKEAGNSRSAERPREETKPPNVRLSVEPKVLVRIHKKGPADKRRG